MNLVILAAGYATRLYPLTKDFPKPLLCVGGKSILDHLLDDLLSTGEISRCAVVTNARFTEPFRRWSAERSDFPVPIEIVDDGTDSNETRLGAVNDLRLALHNLDIGGEVMVTAGDNLLDFSLARFIEYYRRGTTNVLMRYAEPDLERLRKCGVLELGEGDRVISMEEKPAEPKSNWCVPPFYIYRELTVEKIERALSAGCGFDAPGSLAVWLCRREPTRAFEMPGKRYDIGTLESYRRVCSLFEQRS